VIPSVLTVVLTCHDPTSGAVPVTCRKKNSTTHMEEVVTMSEWPEYNLISYCPDRKRWFVEVQSKEGNNYHAWFGKYAKAKKTADMKATEFHVTIPRVFFGKR